MTQNPYEQKPPSQQVPTPVTGPQPAPPPPYQFGAQYPSPRPSAWPKVIGIISLVFSGLGLVCGPLGKAANIVNPASREVYAMFPDWFRTWETVSMLVGIGTCILLLAGGILLLRRRALARALHLAYGALGVVITLVNAAVMVSLFSHPGDLPAPLRAAMVSSAVVGVLAGMAYPVFLLVWFLRPRIAAEVRGWQ